MRTEATSQQLLSSLSGGVAKHDRTQSVITRQQARYKLCTEARPHAKRFEIVNSGTLQQDTSSVFIVVNQQEEKLKEKKKLKKGTMSTLLYPRYRPCAVDRWDAENWRIKERLRLLFKLYIEVRACAESLLSAILCSLLKNRMVQVKKSTGLT